MTDDNSIRLLIGLCGFLSGALAAAGLMYSTIVRSKVQIEGIENWRKDIEVRISSVLAQQNENDGQLISLGESQRSIQQTVSEIKVDIRAMRDDLLALRQEERHS